MGLNYLCFELLPKKLNDNSTIVQNLFRNRYDGGGSMSQVNARAFC